MRLGAVRRCPEAWSIVSEAMPRIRNIDPQNDVGLQRVEADLIAFIGTLRTEMGRGAPSAENAKLLADKVADFLKLDDVGRAFVEYQNREALEIALEGFVHHLVASAGGTKSWVECIDAFEGNGQIPLMTVHKSKGLEYDTILFVGLDDSTWWSYSPANPEGLSTFFVALSRARQRAIFTFCQSRGDRKKIAPLYKLLADAGVPEEEV